MNTEISRYLVDANGNSFSSDADLQSLSKNAKVKNTNSGVSYKKVQGTTSGVPVFDKVPFQEGQPDAVLYSQQSLTTAQKQQARTNIGASGSDAVLYSQQTLTSAEKEQARANIGAIDLTTGKNNFVSTTSSQTFDISTTNRILKNIGIFPFSAGQRCNVIPLGDYQVSFGQSTMKTNNIMDIIHQSPFCSAVTTVVSPLISRPDDNAVCGLVAGTSGPRGNVVACGSDDHSSRVHYVSFGKRFKYNQLGTIGGTSNISSSTYQINIPVGQIETNGQNPIQVLVDMFISRDAPTTDYIEYNGSTDVYGYTRLTTEEITEDPSYYLRGYDFDLGLYAADSVEKDAKFIGYDDFTNCKLIQDSTFRQFKMRSFVCTVVPEIMSGGSTRISPINFNLSLSSGVNARIRVLFPARSN